MGLQDQIIPFSMMLFLAGAMSHADQAKVQVGFSKARYHWPAFAGDTFTKRFTIKSLRSTSDGNNSIFRIGCDLFNQRDVRLFSVEKAMLFPFEVSAPSNIEIEHDSEDDKNEFLDHLITKSDVLQSIGSHSLTTLRPGQLILHALTRPVGLESAMQLATLARLTHERHFNTQSFKIGDLYCPGKDLLFP
jgi:hypothetical protein